jgi:hypothetical protein
MRPPRLVHCRPMLHTHCWHLMAKGTGPRLANATHTLLAPHGKRNGSTTGQCYTHTAGTSWQKEQIHDWPMLHTHCWHLMAKGTGPRLAPHGKRNGSTTGQGRHPSAHAFFLHMAHSCNNEVGEGHGPSGRATLQHDKVFHNLHTPGGTAAPASPSSSAFPRVRQGTEVAGPVFRYRSAMAADMLAAHTCSWSLWLWANRESATCKL